MRRNWAIPRAKVASEGACRACGSTVGLQAAHIIPRSRIHADGGGESADNVICLCRDCHAAQHAGRLELLPMLTLEEQGFAASLVGIEEARRRTTRAA